MNNEFPRMLFKAPGPEQFHGGHFDTKIVNDGEERDAALEDGWHLTTPEAAAALAEPVKALEAPSDPVKEVAPAPAAEVHAEHDDERAALKAEAAELKLIYPRNATNDKLRELIAAAKAPAPTAEGEG